MHDIWDRSKKIRHRRETQCYSTAETLFPVMGAGQTLGVSAGAIKEEKAAARVRAFAQTPWFLSIFLAAGTFLLYCPLNGYEFINYDDQIYVTENYIVQQGLTLKGVKWAFTTFSALYWHPVTWLSHMLDVELFGMNASAHHYVNLLLHSINVMLLFLLLYFVTGTRGRSFVVAALFAVHPLSAQSVMWIAERKNMLSTLFFLLALAAYAWYARKSNWRRYLAVTGFYLLALMSKPMVVTFPFVLLLFDYWPLRRFGASETSSSLSHDTVVRGGAAHPVWIRLLLEKIPWMLMSLVNSVVTLFVQRTRLPMYSQLLPLKIRLGNALLSYALYLWKIVWPAKLSIYYPHPKLALPWGEVALAAAVLIAITFLVWRYRNHSYLAVGWLWFLGMLVPVIGIVQSGGQAMADRYAYLPLIGILIAVVWGSADMLQQANVSRKLVVTLTCLLLAGSSWNMRIQESYWRNSISLFTHALDVTSNNGMAQVNLGMALADKGLAEESILHVQAALAINPRDALALQDLALYHINKERDTSRALAELKQAAAYARYPELQKSIHMTLGALYSKLGNMEEAKSEYRQAILAQPEDYRPYLNLGVHLYLEGKYDDALANLTQSIAVFPTSTAYYYTGETLQAQGKVQEAGESYKKALEISPSYEEPRQALHDLFARMPARGQSR